jgi:hypothetical protein
MVEDSFIGRQGIELTHRNFHCTVCCSGICLLEPDVAGPPCEHHIYIPVDDIEGYDRAIQGLMSQDICPCGVHQECCVADDDGGGCGGEVENLEDYTEIDGEYIPMFTCDRHQGYFITEGGTT